MSSNVTIKYVDDGNYVASQPSALPQLNFSETSNDSSTWHTAAQLRDLQDSKGMLALLRAFRHLLKHNASGFAAAAVEAAASFDDEQFANSDTNYAQTILLQVAPADPTFTSMTPATGAHGSTHATTITGTNFRTGATVTVGGSSATSVVVVSSTSITCTVPTLGSSGGKDVIIANPSGNSVTATGAWTAT